MIKYFVYVLYSLKDRKLYIGQTDRDPEVRLAEHNKGDTPSTKGRRPLDLVYYEMYRDKQDALSREKFLKSGSGHRYLKKQLRRGVEQLGSSLGS
ncbi:MAG: GIY-YIG nuclease family protein [Candidatus Omnitrophica bacterium]|nr:GIY-YIG nuclease family protein [Candidatus Omnitrophota bacterium]